MIDYGQYQGDIDAILARRYDNGADYWATADGKLAKGSPFSTYTSALMLLELGMKPTDPVLMKVADLFFGTWRSDGRFKLYPNGGIYPCQTAYVAHLLCRMGYVDGERVQTTLRHFLSS